jgi:hypothetical protein
LAGGGSGIRLLLLQRGRERERASERESEPAGGREGGEPQRPGRRGSGKRGPGLRDPSHPLQLPSPPTRSRGTAPGTSLGKREPRPRHPARAACSVELSHALTASGNPRAWGAGGRGGAAASPNWDTPTFWAWRTPPDKLSADRSPWWETGLRKSTCDGIISPWGAVLNSPRSPSPSTCFSSQGAPGWAPGEDKGGSGASAPGPGN